MNPNPHFQQIKNHSNKRVLLDNSGFFSLFSCFIPVSNNFCYTCFICMEAHPTFFVKS